MTLTCPQCERSFEPNAKHQIYDVQECRYQGWVEKEVLAAQGGPQRVEPHPLAAARARQEESETNRRFGLLIRQAIIDRLKTVGSCHADDLEGYFPEGERARCRRLVAAQFGSLASAKLIEQVAYLKSSVPARKGSKSWSWKFTKAGWDRWGTAGVGSESDSPSRFSDSSKDSQSAGSPPLTADSGDSDLTGPGGGVGVGSSQGSPGRVRVVGFESTDTASPDKPLVGVDGDQDSQRTVETAANRGDSVHSGESSSAGQLPGKRDKGRTDPPSSASAASPEPLSLLPEPDPEIWAA